MATDIQPLYLEKISLLGYKSIKDIEIDILPGLNIIIGKNAAGKTNFLSFLDKSLSLDFEGMYFFSSWLEFKNGQDIIELSSGKAFPPHLSMDDLLTSKTHTTLTVNKNSLKPHNGIVEKADINKAGAKYKHVFICHGLPENYPIVDIPFSFSLGKTIFANELLDTIKSPGSDFVNDLCFSLLRLSFQFDNNDYEDLVFLRNMVNTIFKPLNILGSTLNNYSNISDVRLSENFNIHKANEVFTINNLFLEFKIDGDWLRFSSLSDGTKRLFYIFSETFDYYRLTNEDYNRNYEDIHKIILIEEPELGVHPHQFKKIMDFLKEQSKTKQIIISTHSPQALNVLGKEDLNRIIIAYATPDGTKLRHLDEQEIEKAKAYIDEVFLSDYWLYSDLEKDTIS